ncbi:MAG: peptidoglycan DD-metalloendopeptidase family protein [Solirubrobacterales bacterium]
MGRATSLIASALACAALLMVALATGAAPSVAPEPGAQRAVDRSQPDGQGAVAGESTGGVSPERYGLDPRVHPLYEPPTGGVKASGHDHGSTGRSAGASRVKARSSAVQIRANTAALQVAMRAIRYYRGSVDGIAGPATRKAVRRFQRRKKLSADGVAGRVTRRKLGRRGNPAWGTRTMRRGHRGWDVAALQFLLTRRGVMVGSIDGGFGAHTSAAVKRFQSRTGLGADGLAGTATMRRLHRPIANAPSPTRGSNSLHRPVNASIGSRFGPRGGRMHAGVDFPASTGTLVRAARSGTVRFAGWNSGGYGNLVVIDHAGGMETWYAHLSSVAVSPGQRVSSGSGIGRVGSTGRSTGPHLHFELRRRGEPLDPMPYL